MFPRGPMRTALLIEETVQAEVEREAGDWRERRTEKHRNMIPPQEDDEIGHDRTHGRIQWRHWSFENRVWQDITNTGRSVLRRAGRGVASSTAGMRLAYRFDYGTSGQRTKAHAPEKQERQQASAVRAVGFCSPVDHRLTTIPRVSPRQSSRATLPSGHYIYWQLRRGWPYAAVSCRFSHSHIAQRKAL